MKRITLLATAAALLSVAGLSGCAKETNLSTVGEPSLLMLTATELATKADTEVLPENTEVGVHVVELTTGETAATASRANLKHVADESGQLNMTDPEASIILTTGYTYDIYSYSPYAEGVSGEAVSAIPVNHGTDILWAKAAAEKPNAKTHSASLVFEHKMAQVEFQVVADAATEPDITGATLKVTGFYQNGTLDLSTGKVKPGSGTADAAAVDETVELTEFGKAVCFVPVDGDMELKVEVTVPGGPNAGVYSGTITRTFAPGKSTLITITVVDRNSELGLEAGLVPWVEETGDVDVNN